MVVNKLLWALFGVFCFVVLLQSYIFFSIGSEVTSMVTQGQVSVSILFVDSRPPTVTILLPPDGSTFSQNDTITIQIRALDDDAVQSVVANFTLSGGEVVEVVLSDVNNDGVFEGAFSQTTLGGTYTMRAIATDVNGFRNDNESIQFTVVAPAPPPAAVAAGAGGGGATGRITGPKLKPVVPTKEIPAPIKFRSKPPQPKPYPEQPKPFTKIPAKVFTLMKSLPALVAENFSVVTGVLTLTVVNALIALYLISFAAVHIAQKYIHLRKNSAHIKQSKK